MQPEAALVDVNAVAGRQLQDLGYSQAVRAKQFGYKRAAAAILSLERSLTTIVASGVPLTSIKGIGPASARVCAEVLEGAAAFVALPPEEKAAIAIDGAATQYRGYSEMKNGRDFREQVHFGPEAPALAALDEQAAHH